MIKVTRGSVVSADGTEIGYSRFGEGPSVVVCHGSYTVAEDWAPFAGELATTHCVYIYDRRGRGRSPDVGKRYTMTCEVDDLAAMVALAGPGAAILGHSFGGGCTLTYALRDEFAGRVVLYEPVHSVPRRLSRGHLPELEALVASNDLEKATEFAMVNIIRAPRPAIDGFKHTPLWPGMVELTRVFPREMRFLDTLVWAAEELRALPARVWMLLGSLTQAEPGEISTVASLVDRIPGLTLYPLIGQRHLAHLEDPALLSRQVTRCLADE